MIPFSVVCAMGALTMVFGWFAGVEWFQTWGLGTVSVKFATSAAAMTSGAVGLRIAQARMAARSDLVLHALGYSMLTAWVAALTTPFADVDPGHLSSAPGVPSVGTVAVFGLFGISSLAWAFIGHRRIMRWSGVLLVLIGACALVGYALDTPRLYYYEPGISTAMAVVTAVWSVALGIGQLRLNGELVH